MRSSLPASIIAAGALVGLGLYFGLRAQAPSPPAINPAGTVPVDPAAPPAQPPGTVRRPSMEQLETEVGALVASAKPRWKAACWDTVDPATRKAGHYISSLAFDATGKITISGVTEHREVGDSRVAQCIRQQVNDTFRITPPGEKVTFEVPFEMP